MFKAVLWDIDLTLLDFAVAEQYAIRRCFEIFGFGECTDEMLSLYSGINRRYWGMLERGEITKQETLTGRFREFFQTQGFPTEQAEAFNKEYQVRLSDVAVFCPHGEEIIKRLQELGISQYAVTNGTVVAQKHKIARLGLDKIFKKVFISDEIGYEKPNVKFFDAVWAELGDICRKDVLLVGDSLTSDMKGANNAGIPCCWYNPGHSINDKGVRIDYEIQDLMEVEKIVV